MSEIKVVRVVKPNECIIYCRGWTISFIWDRPLGEEMMWEEFHGVATDDRPLPKPPNFQGLRSLRPLTEHDRWAAKKRAFGIIQKNRRKALEKAREEARQALEEPVFL